MTSILEQLTHAKDKISNMHPDDIFVTGLATSAGLSFGATELVKKLWYKKEWKKNCCYRSYPGRTWYKR